MADRHYLAAAALAVVALAACGEKVDSAAVSAVNPLDEEVPMPQMRVGDAFEYESRSRGPAGRGDAPSRWTLTVTRLESNGRFHADLKGFDPIARSPFARAAEYDGPWNSVPPAPYTAPEFLRFPLRQGDSWTSVAANPTLQQTRTVVLEVRGRQALEIAGSRVDCVRVEGTDTTLTVGPPPSGVAVVTRLWYCPSLRAVGRLEADIPTVPVVQTLVSHHLQP